MEGQSVTGEQVSNAMMTAMPPVMNPSSPSPIPNETVHDDILDGNVKPPRAISYETKPAQDIVKDTNVMFRNGMVQDITVTTKTVDNTIKVQSTIPAFQNMSTNVQDSLIDSMFNTVTKTLFRWK